MDKQIKTGADRLDTSSTDAMHWSVCYYEQMQGKEHDHSDLMPWFANFWAAVHDPLQATIAQLTSDNERLREILKPIAELHPQEAAAHQLEVLYKVRIELLATQEQADE